MGPNGIHMYSCSYWLTRSFWSNIKVTLAGHVSTVLFVSLCSSEKAKTLTRYDKRFRESYTYKGVYITRISHTHSDQSHSPLLIPSVGSLL